MGGIAGQAGRHQSSRYQVNLGRSCAEDRRPRFERLLPSDQKKPPAPRSAALLGGNIAMLRPPSPPAVVLPLPVFSPAGAEEPLAIAKQGYFFVGGKYST